MSLLRAPLLACCLALFPACTGEDEDAPEPGAAVTDSAGVTIVRNSGPSTELDLVEELRIGTREGEPEYMLDLVREAFLAPGDTIYLTLLRAGEIRVYAPDGTHVRTMGGVGDGPGEFQGLSRLWLTGDTLVALDVTQRRLSLLSTGGEVLQTWPYQFGTRTLNPIARTEMGWLATTDDYSLRPTYEPGRINELVQTIVLLDSPSEVAAEMDSSGQLPANVKTVLRFVWTRSLAMMAGEVTVGRGVLWDWNSQWDLDGAGRIHLTADDQYRIDVFSPDGSLVRSVRRDHDPLPVTPELLDRYLAEVHAHYDTAGGTTEFGTDPVDLYEQDAQGHPGGPVPGLGDIVVGEDGSFLVERPDLVVDPVALEWTRLGAQAEHWDVFGPDGGYLGTVEMPPGLRPLDGSSTWLLGVIRDELDVEYLVRYAIRPGTPGS